MIYIDFKGPHQRALQKIENALVKKYLSNVQPANAESTIAKKKSSKTLIDSGELVGHVTHRQTEAEGQIVGEVGIFEEYLAKRAIYLEKGVVWGHRPNVRADAENREEEEGAREWFIPPRPVLRPVIDETLPKVQDEMANEIWKQIEKQMGW